MAATTNQYRELQRRIRKNRVCTIKRAAEWALSTRWLTIDDLLEMDIEEIPSRLAFEFWTQAQEDSSEVRKFLPRPKGADEGTEKDPSKEDDSGGPQGDITRALSATNDAAPTP